MVRAPSTVFHHGWPRVRDWPIWTESKPLITLLLAVACGYLGWIAFYAVHFHFHLDNLALFAALLACVAFSVEMSRRASEPDGVVKDVYAVWELPMVFLLPGLYALMVPAIRLTLSQWRVRKVPAYRRVYTAATIGIGYGCARFIFMSVLPVGVRSPRLPVERHHDVAGGGRGRRDRPVGDQPGAHRVRLQARQPAREDPRRAVRPGVAAQRRDRALRGPARRRRPDDQLADPDHRAAAGHAAAALVPARAAAERGPRGLQDRAAQRRDLGARGGARRSPGPCGPHRRWRWRCSTSTGSSRSTTPTGTSSATRCCATSPTR